MSGKPCAICRADVIEFGKPDDGARVYKSGAMLDESVTASVDVVFSHKKKRYVDQCVLLRSVDDLRAALGSFCGDSDIVAPVGALELATKSPSLFWSLVAHATTEMTDGADKVGCGSGGSGDDIESAITDTQVSILGIEHARGRSKRSRR